MAKEPKPVPLGPWPLGVNNVDADRAAVFTAGRERPAQLRAAVNVDLDRDGWPRRRVGRVKRLTLDNGHSLASVGGMLLCVDDGALLRVDPDDWSTQLLASVGDAPLSFCDTGGSVYFLSATTRGRLVNGRARPWGLEPPASPLVARVDGQLPAGRYQVAITVEADGLESGSRRATTIELATPGALQVTPGSLDPDAELVNLYCSDTNGRELYHVGAYSAAAAPWVISQVGVSTDLLDGFNVYPPPYGQRVRLFKGRLLVAAGAALYWSEPLAFHRFRVDRDLQLRDEAIALLEPTLDGFYLATRSALWWVGGDDPETWQPVELAREQVPLGDALRVPGSALPALETSAPVLLWATARGFMAGLPGGQVRALTDGRVVMPAHGSATLAYREEDGLRQVLLALRESQAGGSRLASTDTATCEVIKASQVTHEQLLVADGAGGFEPLLVDDGAGGTEPMFVLKEA